MKKKNYLIVPTILLILGTGSLGIVVLFGLFGGFVCGKPFHIINGSNGPIPACTSIFNTDFIWPLIIGICLLSVGIILMIIYKKRNRGKYEK